MVGLTGTPEQVMAYMHFVAEDLRERLAALGLTSLQDAVGRTRLLQQKLKGAKPPLWTTPGQPPSV